MTFAVAKFGGTSVANYAAMQRCAELVLANPQIRLVVVSASAGVTNALVAISRQDQVEQQLNTIRDIQFAICQQFSDPSIDAQVQTWLDELGALAVQPVEQRRSGWSDELLAYGERFSSFLFSRVLAQHTTAGVFDVRNVLRTDSNHGKALPQPEQIRLLCQQQLLPVCQQHLLVTQGFVGADEHGHTTTLGRGGSDYSAALLAAGLNASEVQIWTDVPGVFTTDPRLCNDASAIRELSFSEAAELATFGAKVLHPATLIPAISNHIPVFVGSSKQPELGGTHIRPQVDDQPPVRAVALRRNQILVTVTSINMLHATGFLAEVFGILARHKISVDLVTTSEISIALTLDEAGSNADGQSLLTDTVLEELSALCRVEVERDLALVAVIGNDIHQTAFVSERTFATVAPHNVRLICQGASPHNLCFLVKQAEAEQVVRQLHQCFIEPAISV